MEAYLQEGNYNKYTGIFYAFVYYNAWKLCSFSAGAWKYIMRRFVEKPTEKTSNIKTNLRFGAPPIVSFGEWYLLSSRNISSQENELYACL